MFPSTLQNTPPYFNAQSLKPSQQTALTGFRPKPAFQDSADTFQSVRFEGRKVSGMWHTVLAALAILVPILSGCGTGAQPGATQQQAAGVTSQIKQSLEQDAGKVYQDMQAAFSALEATPLDSGERATGLETLKAQWASLQQEAANGNKKAQQVLQALTVKQLYQELQAPSPQLVRFNYGGFDQLVQKYQAQDMNRDQFNTEVQGRALTGLAAFNWELIKMSPYLSEDEKNPATMIQTVMALLKDNPDGTIQRTGHAVMGTLLAQVKQRSPEDAKTQQLNYLEQTKAIFLDTPRGQQKLQALNMLANFRLTENDEAIQTLFQDLMLQSRARLQDPQRAEEYKYHILLLASLKDPALSALMAPLLTPEAPSETQQAIAWAYGMDHSNESLQAALSLANNPAFTPETREMAIYALAEFEPDQSCTIRQLIHHFAHPAGEGMPPEIQSAAQAMELKFLEKDKLNEPDFYLNFLLPNKEEQTEYLSLRSQYIKLGAGLENLDYSKWNGIDKILIPARHLLPDLIADGGHITILAPTHYGEVPNMKNSGTRSSDGRAAEQIAGKASLQGVTVPVESLGPVPALFAHEFTHDIHNRIWNKQPKTSEAINAWYEAGKARDYYGNRNEKEYAAQGGQAFYSDYIPYDGYIARIFDGGYDKSWAHPKDDLKRRDPELYELLTSTRKDGLPPLSELPQVGEYIASTCGL